MLDEEGVDESDRDRAQEGAGHERTPVEDVAAHELGEDPDRDRLLLGRREEDEGVEKLVPGQGEGEDPAERIPGTASGKLMRTMAWIRLAPSLVPLGERCGSRPLSARTSFRDRTPR